MKLVAGVIGCGSISRFHFSGLEKAGAKIKWTCDLSSDAARGWAERYGARHTTDYADVVADPEVNVVTVATISSTHKRMCTDAIRAGKAVICEKTLAENPDDALAIVRLAAREKTILYTSYMKRFLPAVEKAKELLPTLGPIMSTYIRSHQHWGDIWTEMPASGFFHTPRGGVSPVRRNYGGGVLVCCGSHILDLVCFLLGRPRRLYAHVHMPKGRDYDLQGAALMETDNGTVHYEALGHPYGRTGFLLDGWDERVEINAVKGKLEIFTPQWDQGDIKGSLLVHYDTATGAVKEYRYPAVSPFDRAVAFFCDNIRKGRQGSQPRHTGYDVDELIAHMNKSSSTGKAVSVKYRISPTADSR